jgi:hypothetical protein
MAKRKKRIRPGETVGERSKADDSLPREALIRGLTIRNAARGRKQPEGRPPTRIPKPPQRRRSQG